MENGTWNVRSIAGEEKESEEEFEGVELDILVITRHAKETKKKDLDHYLRSRTKS